LYPHLKLKIVEFFSGSAAGTFINRKFVSSKSLLLDENSKWTWRGLLPVGKFKLKPFVYYVTPPAAYDGFTSLRYFFLSFESSRILIYH